jgi:tetratricopeptide (TPR) repeat protein
MNGWLEYKARAHVLALPVEARLFYRRGVLASRAGKRDEAERWVRAASELDPSFVDPHLTIAAWSLPGRPSQALVHWAAVLDLTRESFMIQAGMAANAVFMTFQSLLVALLIAGWIILALRLPELTHPWAERLGVWLRPETARWWALSFAILPFLAGVGVVLPTIVFLGLLWPVLRGRERAIFVLLAAGSVSIAVDVVAPRPPGDAARSRARAALRHRPVENEPWSARARTGSPRFAAREPGTRSCTSRSHGTRAAAADLSTAEREYRAALERWPGDDRVLTDLGNVLAMQGRQDEALEFYQRAISARPSNPAPHFNESQIYTQRFEYVAATEALSRASAIDFDLVRDYQRWARTTACSRSWTSGSHRTTSGSRCATRPRPGRGRPACRRRGAAASRLQAGASASPRAVCALLAALAGFMGQRSLPLRACSNCGRVVCRRCAQRRREVALCRGCAALETRAQNPDFARVLLRPQPAPGGEAAERGPHRARRPGARFGMIAFRRAVTPLLLIAAAVMLVGPWAGVPLPFEVEPLVGLSDRLPPLGVRIALGAILYAISIAGYFSCAARRAASPRARRDGPAPQPRSRCRAAHASGKGGVATWRSRAISATSPSRDPQLLGSQKKTGCSPWSEQRARPWCTCTRGRSSRPAARGSRARTACSRSCSRCTASPRSSTRDWSRSRRSRTATPRSCSRPAAT